MSIYTMYTATAIGRHLLVAKKRRLVAGRHGREGGFALAGALIIACILIGASVAMTLEVLHNQVESRREQERLGVVNSKEMVGREFMEALANNSQSASGTTGGSNQFSTTFLIAALAAGGKGQTNGRTVTIYDYDTNNPSNKQPATDILSLSTNTLPMSSMVFPSLRFAYVQPGTQFIGRLVQYGVDYSTVSADNLSQQNATSISTNKTSGDLVNEQGTLVVNLLEVPDQLGVEGENITMAAAPGMTLNGGIAGRVIQDLQNNFSGVNMAASLDIQNGQTESERVASLSAETRGLAGSGNRFLATASGSTVFLPVGSRGTNTYAVPTNSDTFTCYWHPYYQCQLRVNVSVQGTNYSVIATQYDRGGTSPVGSVLSTNGTIMRIYNNSDTNWIDVVSRWDMSVPGGGGWTTSVEVDLISLLAKTSADSVYINAPAGANVIVKEGATLSRPFSIVSDNPLYIPTSFGTAGQPFSLFAPVVYYGYPGISVSSVTVYGQRGLTTSTGTTGSNPADAKDGFGNQIPAATLGYSPVQSSAKLPPVYLKSWLINVWQK